MSLRPLVVYYRVSTEQQKRSGLGLMAQHDAVRRYLEANPGRVVAELTEIESGRKDNRPAIKEALWLCRVYDARLIVARLDRLARSTAMIAGLMDSGVDFIAADMPLANRFTIHILAAVAEYEARLISERTKAAFAAAKVRGRTFGNPNPATLHGIALQLTMMEIETPGKRKVWRDRTVAKMFEYAGERKPRPRSSRRTQADRRAAQSDFQLAEYFAGQTNGPYFDRGANR
jgi:DNA invertase Pin-like site-specific DNA recombinase